MIHAFPSPFPLRRRIYNLLYHIVWWCNHHSVILPMHGNQFLCHVLGVGGVKPSWSQYSSWGEKQWKVCMIPEQIMLEHEQCYGKKENRDRKGWGGQESRGGRIHSNFKWGGGGRGGSHCEGHISAQSQLPGIWKKNIPGSENSQSKRCKSWE